MVDFKNLRDSSSGGRTEAGVGVAEVGLEMSASVDTVDGVSSFTLEKKTVDTEKLRKSCMNKYVSVCLSERLQFLCFVSTFEDLLVNY